MRINKSEHACPAYLRDTQVVVELLEPDVLNVRVEDGEGDNSGKEVPAWGGRCCAGWVSLRDTCDGTWLYSSHSTIGGSRLSLSLTP